jgi:hypothetical protein
MNRINTRERKARRLRTFRQRAIALAAVVAASASAPFMAQDALAANYCVTTAWFSTDWTEVGVGFKVPPPRANAAVCRLQPGRQ